MRYVLGLLICLLWGGAVGADSGSGGLTVGARELPVPAGASDVLQQHIRDVAPGDLPYKDKKSFLDFHAAALAGESEYGAGMLAQAASKGVQIKEEEIAGVAIFRVTPKNIRKQNKKRLFLYVHGGAYVFGGGASSLQEPLLIAEKIGIEVLSIDYRMPPADPFPAAVDDVVSVYRKLIAKDHTPNRIILGGTSAGGGLALASTLRFKELDLPIPGAIYAGTAWADLSKTGDTLYTLEGIDRSIPSWDGSLEIPARLYAGKHDLKHPLISPVYGDLSGFPPTILITGTRDILLSDNVRTHRKLRAAGVIADLHVFEGFSHADYIFAVDAPESREVYRELAAFIDRHLE